MQLDKSMEEPVFTRMRVLCEMNKGKKRKRMHVLFVSEDYRCETGEETERD